MVLKVFWLNCIIGFSEFRVVTLIQCALSLKCTRHWGNILKCKTLKKLLFSTALVVNLRKQWHRYNFTRKTNKNVHLSIKYQCFYLLFQDSYTYLEQKLKNFSRTFQDPILKIQGLLKKRAWKHAQCTCDWAYMHVRVMTWLEMKKKMSSEALQDVCMNICTHYPKTWFFMILFTPKIMDFPISSTFKALKSGPLKFKGFQDTYEPCYRICLSWADSCKKC